MHVGEQARNPDPDSSPAGRATVVINDLQRIVPAGFLGRFLTAFSLSERT
jgi:hypothetical protein